MDAEQVVDKILADAKAEAEKIKKQANEKEAAELDKLNEQLDEYGKETKALAERLGNEKKLHLLAAARMDIAKEFLAEKCGILDDVFAQAQTKLQKLPDEQYRELITKLMLEAVETGDEEVILDKNEKRIDEKFLRQINHKLSRDRKGNLKLSKESQPLEGGFILKRGKIKNNVSFDVLLARARTDLEIELAKQLFEN